MDTTLASPHATSTAAPPTTTTPSATARWIGRGLSALTTLFLLFDAAMKLAQHPAVTEASQRLGLPVHTAPAIGLVLLGCVALYVVPRVAPLGAVLLTGYLGGAVLVHVRVGDALVSHTLFPVYVGAMVWAGLYLRDDRVRRLLAAK